MDPKKQQQRLQQQNVTTIGCSSGDSNSSIDSRGRDICSNGAIMATVMMMAIGDKMAVQKSIKTATTNYVRHAYGT